MKYDGTYGDRAERALAAIADGNSAKLVLAAEGFKTDAEWAEALITQHRVDVNFAKAQRDVAEEKISALPEALEKNDLSVDRAYINGANFGFSCGYHNDRKKFDEAIACREAAIKQSLPSPQR